MPKGAAARTSPRKPKLGQHFLTNEAAALRIVEALGDVSEATVLEIGPGRGAITDLLAGKARRLIAVELDRVLSAQLRMKFNMQNNVEIIEGDILKIELDTVFGAKPGSLRTGLNFAPEPARVIGNLPYYITSDILLRLLEQFGIEKERCNFDYVSAGEGEKFVRVITEMVSTIKGLGPLKLTASAA